MLKFTFSRITSFSCWWLLSRSLRICSMSERSRSSEALSRVALCFSSSWSNAICCLCWTRACWSSSRRLDTWASKSEMVWPEIQRSTVDLGKWYLYCSVKCLINEERCYHYVLILSLPEGIPQIFCGITNTLKYLYFAQGGSEWGLQQ